MKGGVCVYKYGGGAGSKQAMLVLVFKRDRILGYHVGTGRKPNGIICLELGYLGLLCGWFWFS